VRNLVLAGAMTLGGGIEPTALSGAFAAQALLADALKPSGQAGETMVHRRTDTEEGSVHAA
jgi:hypothetical protein